MNQKNTENIIPNVDSKEKEERNVPDLRYISECKLKDICFPITYGLAASAIPFDGIHKYIRITDIDENTGEYLTDSLVSPAYFSNEYKVVNNDILFARTGASVGKTYIHTDIDNTYFAGFLMRIRLLDHNPYYIYQQFKTKHFKKWLAIMSMRSGQPGINSAELGNYTIKISSRKLEDKIAEIFIAIDNRIITQKKIIEDLKKLKKSINHKIFKKNIDKTRTVKLSELCEITTGKLDANAMVLNGKYRFYTCAEKYYFIDTYAFDTEALLISGNGANVGYVHYYKGKFNAYQRTYVLFNFKCNPAILKIYLDCFLPKRIESTKHGGNTPYIKLETISNFTINILDIATQNKIINFNSKINQKINNEEKILKLYQMQKDYLLEHMFI